MYTKLFNHEFVKFGKRTCVCLLALAISACGGGGGNDGPSARQACSQYCLFFCAKSANCGFFRPEEIQACADVCTDTTEDIDRSAESCQQAQAAVEGMTCAEIATVIGAARDNPTRMSDPTQAESFGAFCAESGL